MVVWGGWCPATGILTRFIRNSTLWYDSTGLKFPLSCSNFVIQPVMSRSARFKITYNVFRDAIQTSPIQNAERLRFVTEKWISLIYARTAVEQQSQHFKLQIWRFLIIDCCNEWSTDIWICSVVKQPFDYINSVFADSNLQGTRFIRRL